MRKRSNFINFPRLQWAFVILQVIAMSIFFTTAVLLILRYTNAVAEVEIPTSDFLHSQVQLLVRDLVISFFINTMFSAVFFIWYSHRLVGPVVALNKHFVKALELKNSGEEIPELKFRSYDEFHGLADAVNAVLSPKKSEVKSEN